MAHTIAVIDKTGRGHAICQTLITTNPDVIVHYIPGTAGVFDDRITTILHISVADAAAIASHCNIHGIKLIVVAHIDALKADVADTLRDFGFTVFGPSAKAARLEMSKAFCKEICAEAGISSPVSVRVECRAKMVELLSSSRSRQLMVKADWLTFNGNGAIKVPPGEPTENVLSQLRALQVQNNNAPFSFLVEEYLDGVDYSAHYFLNATSVIELPSSLDYKMSHCGDCGTNCDGMGSISPHPLETKRLEERIRSEILDPLRLALKTRGIEFNGAIYLGLRVDANGKPHLIEVNARMGDSESEVILPRVKEDLSAVFTLIAEERSDNRRIETCSRTSLAISLVTGVEIGSKDPAKCWPNTMNFLPQKIDFYPTKLNGSAQVFWANVIASSGGRLQTGVGRVAHISVLGNTVDHARREAYGSLGSVFFNGIRMRCDIGYFPEVKGCFAEDLSCAFHEQYPADNSRVLTLPRKTQIERPMTATAKGIS